MGSVQSGNYGGATFESGTCGQDLSACTSADVVCDLKDPDVEGGRKSRQQALRDLLDKFASINRQGRFSLADFVRYYEGVSTGIDNDQYFMHVVQSVWGLDSSPHTMYARNSNYAREGHIKITEG